MGRPKGSKNKIVIDLSGRRYGRLTVLRKTDRKQSRCPMYECKCDCGTIKVINSNNLRAGTSTSCGCLRIAELIDRSTKHGGRYRRSHIVWSRMKDRCLNPNCKNFDRYGARGVMVCDRWLKYENFIADMGEPPIGLTIERINNDGNYEPSNCRWATRQEQSVNRSNSIVVTFEGKNYSASSFARTIGMDRKLAIRLIREGITIDQIAERAKVRARETLSISDR